MNNTILLPINLLKPNKEALKYAVFTSKNIGAKLLLFNKQLKTKSSTLTGNYSPTSAINAIPHLEQSKKRLQKICESLSLVWEYTRAKLDVSDMFKQTTHKEYSFVEEFNYQDPTLLLIGIKKDFNFDRDLAGILKTKGVTKSKCPVLLLPAGIPYTEILDINYFLDSQKPLSEVAEEIGLLRKMSSTLYTTATINIFCYNKKDSTTNFHIQQKVLRSSVGPEMLTFTNYSDNVENLIRATIQENSTDMFVFPNEHSLFSDNTESGKLIKRKLLQAKTPVLIF